MDHSLSGRVDTFLCSRIKFVFSFIGQSQVFFEKVVIHLDDAYFHTCNTKEKVVEVGLFRFNSTVDHTTLPRLQKVNLSFLLYLHPW